MKFMRALYITIVCISYSVYTMELVEDKQKKITTKGITPLFDPADTQGIKRFNAMHRSLVDHIRAEQVFQPEDREKLACIQGDFYQLKKQCDHLGPKEYLKRLIDRHEAEQERNLDRTLKADSDLMDLLESNLEIKNYAETMEATEFAQANDELKKKRALIDELDALLEDYSSNTDSYSSSEGDGEDYSQE
jgi:hypothetical protein